MFQCYTVDTQKRIPATKDEIFAAKEHTFIISLIYP